MSRNFSQMDNISSQPDQKISEDSDDKSTKKLCNSKPLSAQHLSHQVILLCNLPRTNTIIDDLRRYSQLHNVDKMPEDTDDSLLVLTGKNSFPRQKKALKRMGQQTKWGISSGKFYVTDEETASRVLEPITNLSCLSGLPETRSDCGDTRSSTSLESIVVFLRPPSCSSLNKYSNPAVTLLEKNLAILSVYNKVCLQAARRAALKCNGPHPLRCATPARRIKTMNNFIKTTLLSNVCTRVRTNMHSRMMQHASDDLMNVPLRLSDWGHGRGQDLQKFDFTGIDSLVAIDLSEQCLLSAERRWQTNHCDYSAAFVQADMSIPNFLDRLIATITLYRNSTIGSCTYGTTLQQFPGVPNFKHGRLMRGQKKSRRAVKEMDELFDNFEDRFISGVLCNPNSTVLVRDSVLRSSDAKGESPSVDALTTTEGQHSIFEIIATQFSAQYAASSLATLRTLIGNISRYLCQGGMWCGILPDANEILKRVTDQNGNTFEYRGKHCRISLCDSSHPRGSGVAHSKTEFQTSFISYKFEMDDAVRCQEYTIDFDDLVKLCSENHLRLVFSENAKHYAKKELGKSENYGIVKKMGLFRTMLSVDENDVVALYRVFAFVKE